MNMNDYITIKQASELWEITLNSAYRKAKKEYSEYIKKIDNQLYISKQVFDTGNEKEQDTNNSDNNIIDILNQELRDKQSTIEYLKRELEEKNKDIMRKDDIIIEMNNRLSILLEREQAKGLIDKKMIIDDNRDNPKDNGTGGENAEKPRNSWLSRLFHLG